MCTLIDVHMLLWSQPSVGDDRGPEPHPSGLIVPNALPITQTLHCKCKYKCTANSNTKSNTVHRLTTQLWPAVRNPMIQCPNNIGLESTAHTNSQIFHIQFSQILYIIFILLRTDITNQLHSTIAVQPGNTAHIENQIQPQWKLRDRPQCWSAPCSHHCPSQAGL